MKTAILRRTLPLVLAGTLGLVLPANAQTPAGSAFTWQGRLVDTGFPVTGT